MGEKLVKALRQCRENGNCDTCEYNTGDNADCIDTMMAEAADELERLQDGYDNAIADARYRVEQVRELQAENADLRNELCLKCGKYHAAHLGSCDGCRWKKGAHDEN